MPGVRLHRESSVCQEAHLPRDARGLPVIPGAERPHAGETLSDRRPVARRRLLRAGERLSVPTLGDQRRGEPACEPARALPAVRAIPRCRQCREDGPALHDVRDDGPPRVQLPREIPLLQGSHGRAVPRLPHGAAWPEAGRRAVQGVLVGGRREQRALLRGRLRWRGGRDARVHDEPRRERPSGADGNAGRRHRLRPRATHVALSRHDVREFTDLTVDIPDDFYARVAARHERPAAAEPAKKVTISKALAPTKLRVYEDKRKRVFRAKVLAVEGEAVVLDQTYFYPEGGGQEADHGTIGDREVYDVQKVGPTVLHFVRGEASALVGTRVACVIDGERREALMRNHTATHIVLGAARKALGNHVWQAGAHKAADMARLD